MVQGHTLAYCQDEATLDLGQWWVINQNILNLERFVTLENSIIALLDWVNAIIKKLPIISPIINALESNPDYKWLDDVTKKLGDDVIIGRSKSFSRKPEIKNWNPIWLTSQK